MSDTLHKRQKQQHQLVPPVDGVLKRPPIESDDILIDILSRLPVKCLIQFRCVCKSWRTLISDSHLVRMHLTRAVTGINPNSFRLLVSTNPLESIDYEELMDVYCHFTSRTLYLPVILDYVKVVGSCNGLICLEINKGDVILWNPSTRVTNRLPVLDWYPLSLMFYGFGYDSVAQDYKVILGTNYITKNGTLTTRVAVFTLKTGSWRIVKDLGYVKLNGQGCLLNGALHWIELKWTEEEALRPVLRSRIISFDIAEEKFQELLPLSYLSDQKFISVRVGTIGNCLFVYFFSNHDISITIWLMKEYGVKESCIKLVQIPGVILRQLYGVQFLNPICILGNGEVLMSCDRRALVLYSPKEQTFRTVLQTSVILSLEAAMYVETLVSPVTGNGADM